MLKGLPETTSNANKMSEVHNLTQMIFTFLLALSENAPMLHKKHQVAKTFQNYEARILIIIFPERY